MVCECKSFVERDSIYLAAVIIVVVEIVGHIFKVIPLLS
jgi:hypothetical protein